MRRRRRPQKIGGEEGIGPIEMMRWAKQKRSKKKQQWKREAIPEHIPYRREIKRAENNILEIESI